MIDPRTPVVPLLVIFFAGACAGPSTEPARDAGVLPEATSLDGRALHRLVLSDETRSKREAELAAARDAFEANLEDPDAIIWLGRRTAYLGRYRDAIEIYTRGIERFPGDPRFYRHRGHRYISLRRLELALTDLERASRLIEGRPDEIEPDGLPNARNIPTSTLQSNVWYHLGLAYYLQGNWAEAERCYRECMKVSNNPDMLCATSHWLYMTLRRQGKEGAAAEVLEPIRADLDVIENTAYHQLLLMYRGERDAEELLQAARDEASGQNFATTAYGVANWHHYNGRSDRARAIWNKIVAGSEWAAFGYIAAEAESSTRR